MRDHLSSTSLRALQTRALYRLQRPTHHLLAYERYDGMLLEEEGGGGLCSSMP